MAIDHMNTAVVRQTLGRELRDYAAIAAYLYFCFSALVLYKMAILHIEGIAYSPFGIAAVKALILGKFMLLGHAAHLGEGRRGRRIIHTIALKSLFYLILVIVLTVVEQGVLGLVHGRMIDATFVELWGGKRWEILATSFLMLIVLVPYLMFREINQATSGKLTSFLLRARGRG